MTIFGYRIPMMASLILWAGVWEFIGRFELVLLFPPFTEVLATMGEVVTSSRFFSAVLLTLETFAKGLLLAIAVGVPLGIAMGRIPAVDRLLSMWVSIFVAAPLSALVPVIMLLFGLGEATVIVTVFLFAVWIIVLDTRAGVHDIPPSLLEMARSFGATRLQTLRHIMLFAALPEILAGIRIGLIRGVKGVVIGQLLVSVIGIGHLFKFYSQNFLMEHFWALILILFAGALGTASLIEAWERRIDYYAGERR